MFASNAPSYTVTRKERVFKTVPWGRSLLFSTALFAADLFVLTLSMFRCVCVVVHCSYALFVCLLSSPLQHCRTTVRACDWTLTVEHIFSFTAIFGKICTAHAQKGLFMNFRCKFRHCRSIRRPRFLLVILLYLLLLVFHHPLTLSL